MILIGVSCCRRYHGTIKYRNAIARMIMMIIMSIVRSDSSRVGRIGTTTGVKRRNTIRGCNVRVVVVTKVR